MSDKDTFSAALQYAITGNYIDFGAMAEVEEEKLDKLLSGRSGMRLDQEEAARLEQELAEALRLVYITDNAGEIV
ncbi:ARMT1-like domain-containing protein, partial [Blautia producta]